MADRLVEAVAAELAAVSAVGEHRSQEDVQPGAEMDGD